MRRYTPTARSFLGLWGLCFFTLAVVVSLSRCGAEERSAEKSYSRVPEFECAQTITEGADTLLPVRLEFRRDTLYVSYNRRARLDLFTPEFERLRTLELVDPEPIHPTSFAVADSAIYIVDHAKRAIIVTDNGGKFIDSFNMLPGGETPLSPLAVTFYGGVAYVTDIALRQVLAISMVEAPGITEKGELILRIPMDKADAIGFPSAVRVTLDGRLLIGDAESGTVRVFSCDGRAIYTFDTVPSPRAMAPLGFAVDGIQDPSLQDSARFDPSNVHTHGRFHVVDGNNSSVHMFNPLGRYVASYGSDRLVRPSDISIDTKRARIYIADPQAKRIFVYKYEE
jgi:hypothetical protein